MRLISWNIQWGKGRDGKVDLRRIADVLYGYDADVICLQEVAVNHPGLTGERVDQVAVLGGLLTGFEMAYAVASDLPDGLGGRSLFGNLILSRLPLLEVTRQRLPFPPDPGVPALPRVALEAVVAAPWGPLRVVTTHLEYYSATQRRAQFAALGQLHAEAVAHAAAPRAAETDAHYAVLPRAVDCILCGDFNCTPEAPGFESLQAAEGGLAKPGPVPPAPTFSQAWRVMHPETPLPPTAGLAPSPYFPQPVCFDHVLVTAGLVHRVRLAEVDAATDASDHQPWIIDFSD